MLYHALKRPYSIVKRPTLIGVTLEDKYVATVYFDYFKAKEIEMSTGTQKNLPNHNQVHERFHRTLKSKIRLPLKEHFKLQTIPKDLYLIT